MPNSATPPPAAAIVARLRRCGCVFAEDEAGLLASAARSAAELDDMVDRRVAGLPLEQILGWAEFCGLRISMAPGVFVPRRRTEFLVRRAVDVLREAAGRQDRSPPIVVDLCCGTGAIGAAVATALGPAELHAADIEPAAVRCARRNVAAVGGRVYEGDLYEPLPASLRGRVDLLVVNAPYVPTDSIALMPPEARIHEPLVALDGGVDGLEIQQRVIAAAPQWLADGGHLVIETSERQEAETLEMVRRSGLSARVSRDDESQATVVIGRRSGS